MLLPGKDTLEKQQHSTAYKPYSFYECRIPRYFRSVPMHWHSEFEINYVAEGTGEFLCGGEKFVVGEGGMLFLPPNMLHAASPYQNGELLYYALVFSPVMLGSSSMDRCTLEYIQPLMNGACKISPLIPSQIGNYALLQSAVRQIFSCCMEPVPLPELLLKSELLHFFWLLETDTEIPRRKTDGNLPGDRIRPALEYMMQHFEEQISVGTLAEVTHLSKSYFMNCFKKAVGIGAIEYLGQLRINVACEALSSTEKAVSEIAFQCGYGNLSNFNRQFKKIMGCSPNEYRSMSGHQDS